ncbi:MAG: hypothetical protein HN793_02065 [Rhodospirillaceae bacterium]|jgi:hypothetical protein|nr:hypothetical protein [Rhodospirillaceae bacterium]MBT6959760.1 hypothetical protein [Rhodospirillaceae bacterium]MBT7449588.1 hypothetical protein [Rhodospirillaceae bacterium]
MGTLAQSKPVIGAVLCTLMIVLSPVLADDTLEEKQRKTVAMPLDLPAIMEVDSMDGPDASIRRFFLTSQGIRGQTVPIPETEGWFCTLSQATHVMLDFWPNLNQWVFQVGFSEEAELTAGGLATCHRLAATTEER